MKRRSDKLLDLVLKEDDTIPYGNKRMTPRRRYTIHEIPSPQAFETVTTEHIVTTPSKKSKRAKSLFLASQYSDSEKISKPLVGSLDECCTLINRQENKSICRDRDLDMLIEPQPSSSKHSPFLYSPPDNENLSFLRSGVKTRGGMRRNTGIKILKCQKVDLHDGQVTLINLEENSEGNDDLKNEKNIHTDLDKSVPNLDIMDEMRNIFEGEDKEEKPKAKLSSTKLLTEEELIKMLELEDDYTEEESDQENLSDDCLYSDASEDATQISEDRTQLSEDNNINFNETLQLTDDEWKSERDPTIVPIDFDGYEKKLKILPETYEPYGYFKLIATDEFFTMLVTKINNYAFKLLSNILDPNSRLRLWKDVTVPEIKTFLLVFCFTWELSN
ncbi:unnamed protein product [Parnassius mnemosyne]|uniref:PiggyBac transposable element-derived protein domain-containing protein n=1 Tax=Parnassius mnemosyne TaxID=213953 RepID=A0AAV1KQ89_9NEOP